jgi:hypothetical protein
MGFDEYDGDSPIMDDPNLENYNLQDKAQAIVVYFKFMSTFY